MTSWAVFTRLKPRIPRSPAGREGTEGSGTSLSRGPWRKAEPKRAAYYYVRIRSRRPCSALRRAGQLMYMRAPAGGLLIGPAESPKTCEPASLSSVRSRYRPSGSAENGAHPSTRGVAETVSLGSLWGLRRRRSCRSMQDAPNG
ncbi:hypothetical protein BDY21DRAFT_135301 [Lineolata rhizophorae]|uniref:Uncharacterized protein n=1 Tax=Lineolata rhizophorae TaxID=578093 RepID=A0A6A6PBX0_9PEZI|nr:hypothetical protein BDY21DRAFT_135301 [Lineolata rhizophorae]